MHSSFLHRTALLALVTVTAPAFADDCANAMLATAKTPYSTVSTRTDGKGKQTLSRMIQMQTAQYVQTPDGKWHSIPVSVKDKIDHTAEELKTATLTCTRVGTDALNGVATAVYTAHIVNDGVVADSKIWIAANQLIVRSDSNFEGLRYRTEYDYTHVAAPANAKPLASR